MNRFRVLTWTLSAYLIIAVNGCGGIEQQSPSISPQTGAVVPAIHRMPRGIHKGSSSEAADWDSFGYDLQRTGYNPLESTVSVDNVGSLQKLWTVNVGYDMVHEPVLASGVSVNGYPTNILYAGSGNGSALYAINADTGAVLWKYSVPHAGYRCYNENLTFSVGETPAIDRGKNLVYFGDGHNQVHAVDLATGKQAQGWPLTIADYSPDHNFMHGGLTYNPANGMLYAVTGSTCDITPWYGRIVAISTTGPSVVNTFYTMSGSSSRGASGGGIWGPGGASIDPNTGNVFVATGNADTHHGAAQNSGYAEQIIELSSTLSSMIASNYPPNIPDDGDNDFDFGATPLIFQPYGCPELLAAVNKSGMFELYDVSSISYGPVQYLAMAVPSDKADFVGVPAYDPVTGYVYIGMPSSEGVYKAGLAAFSIESNCTLNPTPVWAVQFPPDGARLPRSQTQRSPVSIANGVVYVANYSRETEFAYDASTGAQLWTVPLSNFGDVGTVIANGIVYVSSKDGNITAWAPPPSSRKKR